MKQIYPNIRYHFNLRSRKGNRTVIYLVINFNRKQIKLPTGLFCNPKHWNSKKEVCMINDNFFYLENLNNKKTNEKISQIHLVISNFFLYFCSNSRYWEENFQIIKEMKMQINNGLAEAGIKVRTRSVSVSKSNWDCVKWLYGKVAADEDLRDSTKETYRHHVKRLDEFLTEQDKRITEAKQINNEFMGDFYDWLKGRMQTGSANANIEKFKTMLNKYAIKDNIMTKTEILNLWFDKKETTKESDEIAVTDEEVMKIYAFSCENERDKIIRDMWVLECCTGQRISDLPNVIKGYYKTNNGVSGFRLVQRKTNAIMDCPIKFVIADEILEKYHDTTFNMPNRNEINKRIKVIAKAAGITGDCIKTEQHGAQVIPSTIQRYDAISTHTGRRTFTTLLRLRGWSVGDIQQFTGHKTNEMVDKYTKLSPALIEYFKHLPEDKKLKMKDEPVQVAKETVNSSLDEAFREKADLEDAKKILYYIGVEPDEYMELETADEAYRLLYKYEERLLTSGLDLHKQIKALYNAKDKSLKERKEALKALVDEARKGLK